MFKRLLMISLFAAPSMVYAITESAAAAVSAMSPAARTQVGTAVAAKANVQAGTPETGTPETGSTAATPGAPGATTTATTAQKQTAATRQFIPGPSYVGVSLGTRINYNSSPSIYKAIAGTLFAGVGTLMNEKIYLGGEIFFDTSGNVRTYRNPESLRSTWSFGFDGMPGFTFGSPILVYGRIGAVSTNFTSPSSRTTGFRLGFGLQTSFYQKWDVRVEWVETRYRAIKIIGGPLSTQFNLGLLYKFL